MAARKTLKSDELARALEEIAASPISTPAFIHKPKPFHKRKKVVARDFRGRLLREDGDASRLRYRPSRAGTCRPSVVPSMGRQELHICRQVLRGLPGRSFSPSSPSRTWSYGHRSGRQGLHPFIATFAPS